MFKKILLVLFGVLLAHSLQFAGDMLIGDAFVKCVDAGVPPFQVARCAMINYEVQSKTGVLLSMNVVTAAYYLLGGN